MSNQYTHPSSQCHISLDIETLGTKPGCKIIEIGMARMFVSDPNSISFQIGTEPYMQEGLIEDPDTVAWWAKQSIPRPDKLAPHYTLAQNLSVMRDWILDEVMNSSLVGTSDEEAVKQVYIWAKSPSFDCAILKYAFEVCSIALPWTFRGERDVRTAIAISNYDENLIEFIGTPHVALDDAVHQAKIVEECYRRLDIL